MRTKEVWDYQVKIEPYIKSLEFTLNRFEQNSKFQASLLFPVYELYPCELKKNENPEHKAPHKYIEERYELNSQIPLGIIVKGYKCLELTIKDKKIETIKNNNLEEFTMKWVFDREKYENSTRYQILELGQINSAQDVQINEEQIIFTAIEFYNNYYPYLNKSYGITKHYAGFEEVSVTGSLALIIDDDDEIDNHSRIDRI